VSRGVRRSVQPTFASIIISLLFALPLAADPVSSQLLSLYAAAPDGSPDSAKGFKAEQVYRIEQFEYRCLWKTGGFLSKGELDLQDPNASPWRQRLIHLL